MIIISNPLIVVLVIILLGILGGIGRLCTNHIPFAWQPYAGAAILGIIGALLAWWGTDTWHLPQPGQFSAALVSGLLSEYTINRILKKSDQ